MNGQWCQQCCGKARHTIDACIRIAKEKNGKCLSKKYINNATKMHWKCKSGHQWYASFHHIKNRGHWCPECGQKKKARSANNSYICYHWKTDKELVCQGSWEAKVVEYLNTNKINFRWQPRSFKMPNGRRYYPDMYLYSTRTWVEIKGYFWDDAELKWNWFQSVKPNSELWNKEKLKAMGIL